MYLILSSFKYSLQLELIQLSSSLIAWFDADQSLQEWMGYALPSYPPSVWTWESLLSLVPTYSHIFPDTKPAPIPRASHLVRVFTFMWVAWTRWIIVSFVTIGALASPSWRDTPGNCKITREEMLSSAPVALAYIKAWVWADDLNVFPLSLDKVTYPIIREIPNE